MRLVPVSRAQAKQFIARHHRHNVPSISSVFNVGLEGDDGELIGVAMAGLPKARKLMDGETLEVTRTCVLEGQKNANSMLYGACARAASALGWKRLITYTLPSESGVSLKAAGWVADEGLFGGSVENWAARYDRPAVDMFGNSKNPAGPKMRWRKRV